MPLTGDIKLNNSTLVTWRAVRLSNRSNKDGHLYEWTVTKRQLGTTQSEPTTYKGRLRHPREEGAIALARRVMGSAMIAQIANEAEGEDP
jgi:hypothetical protein